MIDILFQAIKLAPRLLWQMYFQPSKAYEFITADERNEYLFLWAFYFMGFFFGGILAVLHYYIYHQSISLVFVFGIAFTGAITAALEFALVSTNEISFANAVIVAFTAAFIVTFVFEFNYEISFVNAVVFIFVALIAGAFGFIALIAIINAPIIKGSMIFITLIITAILININSIDVIVLPNRAIEADRLRTISILSSAIPLLSLLGVITFVDKMNLKTLKYSWIIIIPCLILMVYFEITLTKNYKTLVVMFWLLVMSFSLVFWLSLFNKYSRKKNTLRKRV